ncbi:hypothetical protein BBJ28_00009430 [Nothophytophthora sp. Chile5]|nr:hypothetical protein BBJ28_00009430 [Nothophytophthora sp. Chile5]
MPANLRHYLEHSFGRSGTAPGEFRGVSDVKFTLRGYLAIVDSGNHRIQVMTATGIVVQVIGRHGWKLGEFVEPSALALDRNGDLFVCDEGNKRIQRFSAKGKPLLQWGSRRGQVSDPRNPMNEYGFDTMTPAIYSVFETPCDLTIGLHGEIIVCDSGKRELLVFSDLGECLHVVHAPHIFQSSMPTAIAMCSNLLVAIGRSQQSKVDQILSPAGSAARGSEDVQKVETFDYLLAVFPPVKRVFVGQFAALSEYCVHQIVCYLTYTDALRLRLVDHYFHEICRHLRNQWKLFPLTRGHSTVMKYDRVVSPATGLAAVEEAFEKWGLRSFKPSNRIRKHVMDFQSGFCSALSTLYGPLFCYQHEEILRAIFRFHAVNSKTPSGSSREKEEIDRLAFIEIATQIEEVQKGFLKWEHCTAFQSRHKPSASGLSEIQRVPVPPVRAAENVAGALGGVPLPNSLRLVENAQQHQLTKLLRKLQAL